MKKKRYTVQTVTKREQDEKNMNFKTKIVPRDNEGLEAQW